MKCVVIRKEWKFNLHANTRQEDAGLFQVLIAQVLDIAYTLFQNWLFWCLLLFFCVLD